MPGHRPHQALHPGLRQQLRRELAGAEANDTGLEFGPVDLLHRRQVRPVDAGADVGIPVRRLGRRQNAPRLARNPRATAAVAFKQPGGGQLIQRRNHGAAVDAVGGCQAALGRQPGANRPLAAGDSLFDMLFNLKMERQIGLPVRLPGTLLHKWLLLLSFSR
ncbi:hypothetical protein D3C72_1160580 [compost metagenome]